MRRSACLLVLCLACTSTRMARSPEDAAGRLREQIAEAPDDIRRGILLDELAKVELDRARNANTVLAYRRFLAEFPNGEEATTARTLLEELRFKEAEKVDTREAWEAFLEEHPRGKHAGEARTHLGTFEIAAALTSQDLALVRHTLARYPEHPRRAPLVAHEDDLAWAVAKAGGLLAVDTYTSEHPNGVHRPEATARRDELEQTDILESDDLPRARARAAAADATEQRRATVLALRLRRALESLDLEALRQIATEPQTEAKLLVLQGEAKQFVDSWAAQPPSHEMLAAIQDARPGHGLLSRAELLARIGSGDPVEQVAAMRELVEWAQPADVEEVLKALSSHVTAVRLAAVDALRAYATALKPAVWASLARTKEQEALSSPTNDSWLRVAALRDAQGHRADALVAWQEALRIDPDDLVAHARIFALEQAGSDRLAAGAAARALAKAAISFADGRVPTPADPAKANDTPKVGAGEVVGLPLELISARQICAATGLASQAAVVLGQVAAAASPAELEFVQLAKTDTENAIKRLQTKQLELEQGLVRLGVRFPPCGADLGAATIAASRARRARAIAVLARSQDARLKPFLSALVYTPAAEVRTASNEAVMSLSRASTSLTP